MGNFLIERQKREDLKIIYNELPPNTKEMARRIFGDGLEDVINNKQSEMLDSVINAVKTAMNNER